MARLARNRRALFSLPLGVGVPELAEKPSCPRGVVSSFPSFFPHSSFSSRRTPQSFRAARVGGVRMRTCQTQQFVAEERALGFANRGLPRKKSQGMLQATTTPPGQEQVKTIGEQILSGRRKYKGTADAAASPMNASLLPPLITHRS